METANPTLDDDHPSGFVSRLLKRMNQPVDILPLVYFRVIFGLIMMWEVSRYFSNDWIRRYFISPDFLFKYHGFEWVHALPGLGMYFFFAGLAILAALIALGLCYRIATVAFFLGFTYVFLLAQSNYLNHFYLISLVSLLLIVLPANRFAAIDVRDHPESKLSMAPVWTLWLLRFQLAIPYFFGGIAKINSDWLHGEPMRDWLAGRQDFPLVGSLFTEEWVVYAFSYGGLVFDLIIVPLLMWKRTRVFAVIWIMTFHLMNAYLFSIGIFPWFMMLVTPVFFSPSWFRRLPHQFALSPGDPDPVDARVFDQWKLRHAGLLILTLFVAYHVLMPLRHHLYPGNVSWTEEGHRFAWHMKLRDKDGRARFTVSDPESGKIWSIDPEDYLSDRQERKMSGKPDMILQFGHYLADRWEAKGYPNVEVYAEINVSLNGRRFQPLVDPKVDLAKQRRTMTTWPWIVSLHEPLLEPGEDRDSVE